MVNPSRKAVLASERKSRPIGYGLVVADGIWEASARLGEHVLLSKIADAVGEHAKTMTFLNWTVDHPWLFISCLAVGYFAFSYLRAVFSSEHEVTQEEREVDAAPRQETHGDHSPIAGKDQTIGHTVTTHGSQSPGIARDVQYGGMRVEGNATVHALPVSSGPPRVLVVAWGQLPASHALAMPHPSGNGILQHGFQLANDGGPAYDVKVEDFAVYDHTASSLAEQRIDSTGGFILVWLDFPPGFFEARLNKFDLAEHIRFKTNEKPRSMYAMDWSVPIVITYHDGDARYRTTQEMTYAHGRLAFRGASFETLGPIKPRLPLNFLSGNQPRISLSWIARDPTAMHKDNYDLVRITNEGDATAHNVAVGDFSWPEIKWHTRIEIQAIEPDETASHKAYISGAEIGFGSLLLFAHPGAWFEGLSLPITYRNSEDPQIQFTRTFSFRRGAGRAILVDHGQIVSKPLVPQQGQ